ncbi:phage tail protein [Glaesserella parasuis]|uniref:phage tail protein n=1 Tax=Glaesserella parasuis TaxID=738 RepID=UPI0021BDBE39|nr:phage tail protein [Glaesserella parasuis]MCT8824372.1 phage tail protein [Glaesserella parasuis]MCT8830284.1 phage tail protein [Glaesserella parasuis]MCT8834559.1 phage tail protein [Glaesserella parasuis]MDG6450318.1 phage tail protein [Glaesserella parasuis]MDO9656544.1 phage tail protein [Glaesserella parasuis]
MKKMLYQQLTDYVLEKLPDSYRQNLYSWMENGKLINEGGNVTQTGIVIAHIEYDSVLFFENLPFRKINPYKILAMIQIWLNENEYLRNVMDEYITPFDIEVIDENSAEFSLTIKFREPITAELDSNGDLEIDGERYRLDEIEINEASEFYLTMKVETCNQD